MKIKQEFIGELNKNAVEKYVFSLKEFKGKKFIDVRIFYLVDPVKNEWRPTKKGITITAAIKNDFMKIISNAVKKLS